MPSCPTPLSLDPYLCSQLYYEAAFLALDAVSPITHSIGNNIKRIVIVVTSVIIFGQKMSTKVITNPRP
jgi:hypothetical protein